MDWLQNHIWPAEGAHVSRAVLRRRRAPGLRRDDPRRHHLLQRHVLLPGRDRRRRCTQAGMRATVGLIVLDFPTAWAAGRRRVPAQGPGSCTTRCDGDPLVAHRSSRRTRRTRCPTRRCSKVRALRRRARHRHPHARARDRGRGRRWRCRPPASGRWQRLQGAGPARPRPDRRAHDPAHRRRDRRCGAATACTSRTARSPTSSWPAASARSTSC